MGVDNKGPGMGTLEYELLRLLLHHIARGLHVLGAEVGLSLRELDRAYLNT